VDPAERLQEPGGARVVLGTASSATAIEAVVGGLGRDGELVAVGVPGKPVSVDVQGLIGERASVGSWGSGHARDSRDTMEFSALRDVTPETETYELDEAAEAYERTLSNEARVRVVLEP
jgi:D-arabinose 1-dehydrogenase-like Zn-dependent alcohol dehydrogenase